MAIALMASSWQTFLLCQNFCSRVEFFLLRALQELLAGSTKEYISIVAAKLAALSLPSYFCAA
jgi:hypothetical protein